MTEQALLDLAGDFKEIVSEKDLTIDNLKEKLLECRKDFITSYALVRVLDNQMCDMLLYDPDVKKEVETIRSILSELLSKFIMSDI
tara:strand:- start:505 stop:762 length:258 start_codon:yes stop_codon:yes gene_type:complete